MKFNALVLSLIPAALALPATSSSSSDASISTRQSANTITDQLLFSVTLPQFTARRNARDPATLDWTSDGCTSSPDNPFGFPFVPACNRHDFGYNNYRLQSRFTKSAKLSIDTNFKAEYVFDTSPLYPPRAPIANPSPKPVLPMLVRDRQGGM